MKHIHAENMRLYAEDAMETDKPWERWESRDDVSLKWWTLQYNPYWDTEIQYRRKPSTIKVNGFDVPEPVRGRLKHGALYFLPSPSIEEFSGATWTWVDDGMDEMLLSRGLIHLTKDNAIIHAKAMLGIDPYAKSSED